MARNLLRVHSQDKNALRATENIMLLRQLEEGGGFTNNLEKCVLNVYYEGDGGYIKTRGGMAEGEVGWDIPLSGYCNVKFVKVQFMILEHMLSRQLEEGGKASIDRYLFRVQSQDYNSL